MKQHSLMIERLGLAYRIRYGVQNGVTVYRSISSAYLGSVIHVVSSDIDAAGRTKCNLETLNQGI